MSELTELANVGLQWHQTPEQHTGQSRAWLLELGGGYQAAVGFNEMSQIIQEPVIFSVPCTPIYCQQVLLLDHKTLPLLDVTAFLSGQAVPQAMINNVAIINYQDDNHEFVQQAALYLEEPPSSINLHDNQACDLPTDEPRWQDISVACFEHNERAVPVLNLLNLLSRELAEQVSTSKEV